MFGLTISEIRGLDGKIELRGIGAVVALIQKWKLERRGDDGSGNPTWTLRAALSYPAPGQPAPMLMNPGLPKRIWLNLSKQETLEAEIVGDLRVEGEQLVIEGVRVWPRAQQPSL